MLVEQHPKSSKGLHIQHKFPNNIHRKIVRQLLHGEDFLTFRLLPQNITKHCRFFHYLRHKRRKMCGAKAGIGYVPPCFPHGTVHRDEIKVAGYKPHEPTHCRELWKRVFLCDLERRRRRGYDKHPRNIWPIVHAEDGAKLGEGSLKLARKVLRVNVIRKRLNDPFRRQQAAEQGIVRSYRLAAHHYRGLQRAARKPLIRPCFLSAIILCRTLESRKQNVKKHPRKSTTKARRTERLSTVIRSLCMVEETGCCMKAGG
jgi:hypothetical protein